MSVSHLRFILSILCSCGVAFHWMMWNIYCSTVCADLPCIKCFAFFSIREHEPDLASCEFPLEIIAISHLSPVTWPANISVSGFQRRHNVIQSLKMISLLFFFFFNLLDNERYFTGLETDMKSSVCHYTWLSDYRCHLKASLNGKCKVIHWYVTVVCVSGWLTYISWRQDDMRSFMLADFLVFVIYIVIKT